MPAKRFFPPMLVLLLPLFVLAACSTGPNQLPGNGKPVVTIASPSEGAALQEVVTAALASGAAPREVLEVLFSATARDPEDGDLSASIQWKVEGGEVLGTGASLRSGLGPGSYTVSASVTDAGGQTGQDQVAFAVEVVVVPEATAVLDAATRDSLEEFAPDGTLRFSGTSAFLTGLRPGDILVSEPTEAAPNGLLRKVVAVRQGDALLVETEQATLEEAVFQGSFHFEKQLTPADVRKAAPLVAGVTLREPPAPANLEASAEEGFTFDLTEVVLFDADGDSDTTDDRIVANGTLNFDPLLEIDGDLDFDCCFDVDLDFKASVGITERTQLKITGKATGTLDVEVSIERFTLDAVTVFIGPVPVVFTPTFDILVGANGEVAAELSFAATQQLTIAAGVQCDPGCDPIGEVTSDFSGEAGAFEGNLDLKGYAGVKLAVLVYGVIGPYVQLDAYLELDGKVPRSPTWLLFGGVEGLVGVDIDVLGFEKQFETKVLDTRSEIARAGNSPPQVAIAFPDDGDELGLNRSLGFKAAADDAEDGADCCSFTWRSSRDGILGTMRQIGHTFTTLGTRTVTVTATDSAGAKASASITVDIVNNPPNVAITKPTPGEEIFRDVAFILRGSMEDANEPDIDCEGLTWTSSVSTDPFPVVGCSPEVTFSSDGPRTLTVSGIDSLGATSTASVGITVVPPPDTLPPTVQITDPDSGFIIGDPDDHILLGAEATDTDSDEAQLGYIWSIVYPYNPETGTGPNSEQIVAILGPAGAHPPGGWQPSSTISIGCGGVLGVIQLKLEVVDPVGNIGSDFVLSEPIFCPE